MARQWYVSRWRHAPNMATIPGHYDNHSMTWCGPDHNEMKRGIRGPEPTCEAVLKHAVAWRAEGKTSDLYLVLVETNEQYGGLHGWVTHCVLYKDPT